MKHKKLLAPFFCLLLAAVQTLYAQFTPEEITQREEIEEYLKTAKIVKAEDIGEGVTKPIRLYLEKDGNKNSGCWKNPEGLRDGHLEGWQYEIAAYQMDKLLGLNMIPPTVERSYDGRKGSLQLWIVTPHSLLDIMNKNIPMPATGPDAVKVSKAKYLARAFDSLIGNEDRTQQNIRYTEDWRTILIDHSRSFRSKKKYCKRLMYGKNGLKEKQLFRRLPRVFVEKLKGLDFEIIKQAVAPYLTDQEINAIIARKKLLLEEIEDMIKKNGVDRVLY
jgi:hypothetical protein